MENFKTTYKRLCREHHIEQQECVISALNGPLNISCQPVLNLSTNSLSPKTCLVLGKILASDRTFREVKLNDCMLSEDGVKGLANGLTSNVYCKKLHLKGNNIRGAGAEALGKLLRHNRTLLSVCLEWNSIGILDSSLRTFCESLAVNDTLAALDLRNNQISHDGAVELAMSLKRNATLKTLDLRWNNIGLLGGRAVLDMLQTNKTLTRLELAGNNVPKDILASIESCVVRNAERMLLVSQHSQRTKTLADHLRHVEKDKNTQMNEFMNTIDKQENELRQSKRSSADKIGQLQSALEERKNAFNSLAAKLALTQSELTLSEQKSNDLNTLHSGIRCEMSEMSNSHQTDLRREKEDRAITEAKLLKELSEYCDKNVHLTSKNEDFERKCKQQTEMIYDLKEQITHLQADHKIKAAEFEERLQASRQQFKDDLREGEQTKQQEISRVRLECEESCNVLRNRIKKMDVDRMEFEGEITRLKSALTAERVQADEHLGLVKQRLKNEEEQRTKHLEDKLRGLQTAKDEMESHGLKQSGMISELQTKNNNSHIEIDSLKRQLEDVQQELSVKSSEVAAQVSKVKHELSQQQSKVDAERQLQTELRDQLNQADKQLSQQMLSQRSAIEEKDKELVSVREKLKARELELTRVREEETQRANLLQSAIMNYCSRPYTGVT